MNILHVASSLVQYDECHRLQNLCIAQQKQGYSLCVLYLSATDDALFLFRHEGIPIQPIEGQGLAQSLYFLRRFIHRFKPDVLHTHGYAAGTAGRLASVLMPRLQVVSSLYNEESAGRNRFLQSRRLQALDLQMLNMQRNTRVLASSDSLKRYLSERQGIDPSKIYRLYDYALHPKGIPHIPASQSVYGQHRDEVVFLCVGRFERAADAKTLLDAAAHFLEHDTSVVFLVANEAPANSELSQTLAARRLTNVQLVDFPAFLPLLYASADVYLHIARQEGFPSRILDAFSGRVPVIAADTPVVRELVVHQVNGLLYPAHNSSRLIRTMSKVLAGEFPLNAFTIKAHDKMPLFSLERYLSKLMELYITPFYKR